MSGDLEKIQYKLIEAINPNSTYSIEDFNKEFSTNSTSTSSFSYEDDMFKLKVKFINKSLNEDPSYATDGAAGFDFRADIKEPLVIQGCKSGNNIKMIPTGLYFEIPENLELQVRPRSGLAVKHGITVLNSPGTVDSDYRGEIKIILINHSVDDFTINPGDRIAQGVINAIIGKKMIKFNKVNELNNTERNEKGFGSTGIK